MRCPECRSERVVKNGKAIVWKARKKHIIQQYRCNSCGRQFRQPWRGHV